SRARAQVRVPERAEGSRTSGRHLGRPRPRRRRMTNFDPLLLDAFEGAQNCALGVANVKEGESVLIVMHSESDLRIAEVIGAVCRGVGARVDVIIVQGPERGATVSKS